MTFQESIQVCLSKYAIFEGRADRSELWWFFVFVVLVSAALSLISPVLYGLFYIAMFLPQLAVGARRLNDIGKNPWWLLFLLVPVGGIILLMILWALPGENDTVSA